MLLHYEILTCFLSTRYAAIALPIRYRVLVSRSWHYFAVVAALWLAALATFAAPLFTKHNLVYYRYSNSQKMCGLHWEYPEFAIVTGFYIPIMSGIVLIVTALGISSTLRRRMALPLTTDDRLLASPPPAVNDIMFVEFREGQQSHGILTRTPQEGQGGSCKGDTAIGMEVVDNVVHETPSALLQPATVAPTAQRQPLQQLQQQVEHDITSGKYRSQSRWTRANSRTLRILMFTGIAYFLCWGPYTTLVFVQCFVPTFKCPSVVEFSAMWLANANSGLNVFIYSSTNTVFRHQCVNLLHCLVPNCCRCCLRFNARWQKPVKCTANGRSSHWCNNVCRCNVCKDSRSERPGIAVYAVCSRV